MVCFAAAQQKRISSRFFVSVVYGLSRTVRLKNLSRIENIPWIKDSLHIPQDAHVDLANRVRQERFLGQSNPMFTGDRTAQLPRVIEDFRDRLVYAVDFVGITFIGEKRRMD